VIIVAVGTFVHGFDELVEAADGACARLRRPGLAQIGHSRVLPRWLTWQRFLAPEALRRALGGAQIVVCHGGMGLLGDAMRAGRPIVAVPRRGPPSRDHPAGDQLPFLRRLAEVQPIHLCEHLSRLEAMLQRIASADERAVTYDLETDLPDRLAAYLQAGSTS
jgi:UDP-N-acetylglucosamine transferase subunit ALG13